MSTQLVNISLPKELVAKIDRAAKGQYASRSEYIRQAVVGRLRDEEDEAWDRLIVLSDELSTEAERVGLVTDEDFVKAVKAARSSKNR
ncbi:MAG TPA: ribbon-helix-helix domain-containing protein [Candidatus Saccharimonadales bacterium]|jgi:Arc/MetJ-type ribon-helix-helix transcriptional regulator